MLVPGAVDCIQALYAEGLSLALASAAGRWYVERIIDRFDIHRFFSSVLTGWDVKRSKPAPDIFVLTAAQLNADPGSCAVIEDSENGVRAAKEAGMKVVGFQNPRSVPQDLSDADLIVRSLPELDSKRLYGLF
jgi:HAD superfamily hydrolase (TIGR01509 family)